MKSLSHQDEIIARGFFAENQDVFGDWIARKATDVDHFAGIAEAATLFVAFCAALGKVGDAMDTIDKVTKQAKALVAFAKNRFGKEGARSSAPFKLSERLLVLIFDNYMRSGKGISIERLVALTGASQGSAEKELKRFESGGVVRLSKSGWLVAH